MDGGGDTDFEHERACFAAPALPGRRQRRAVAHAGEAIFFHRDPAVRITPGPVRIAIDQTFLGGAVQGVHLPPLLDERLRI